MGPKEALKETVLSAKTGGKEHKAKGLRPFRGYCNNCGRYGHRQSECPEEDSSAESAPKETEVTEDLSPEEPIDEPPRGRKKEQAQGALCATEVPW
jgi:hypothetical protein